MAFLGFTGGLLHVLNHALFKSLLFLGAGAVQHSYRDSGHRPTGRAFQDDARHRGQRSRRGVCDFRAAPVERVCQRVADLPRRAHGVADPSRDAGVGWALLGVLVVGGLALIGGLAAACFTKAFGCVFLGEPRSDQAQTRPRGRRGDAGGDARPGGGVLVAWP